MVGKMVRTTNTLVESYIGALIIKNNLCIQTAIKVDDTTFATQKLLLSREAVETLIPLLQEYLLTKEEF